MKLSTAIRIGAQKHPQCRGQFFSYTDSMNGPSHCYATCVLGAALVGSGFDPDTHPSTFTIVKTLGIHWPFLVGDLYTAVLTYNDHHHQTREEIADILENLGH